ncbi:MAG: hypothetical protein AUJ49_04890 [Desulfovibrionaceae bacterium CG1_02_65_16]|nr:MAG: hypothetical protein AUJ49_04890 [Desulfovibrionaceae bacterium CG1_02_65_16]
MVDFCFVSDTFIAMNALERFRTDHGLTFEALGKKAGVKQRGTVFRHCQAGKIPGDAALLYHAKLGIPLEDLRPDLWTPATGGTTINQPQDAA